MTGKHRQRGFSLIEAAIVLGVVGIVIGGIWWGASAVRERIRVNQMADGIMKIYYNGQRIFYSSSLPNEYFLANSTGWNIGLFQGADGFYLVGNEIYPPLGKVGSLEVSYRNNPTYQGLFFYPKFLGEKNRERFCEQLWAAMALRFRGQESKVKWIYVDGIGDFWPNFSTTPTGEDWCWSFELSLAF